MAYRTSLNKPKIRSAISETAGLLFCRMSDPETTQSGRFGPCRCLPTSRTWRESHVTRRHKYSSPGRRRVTSSRKSRIIIWPGGQHGVITSSFCCRHSTSRTTRTTGWFRLVQCGPLKRLWEMPAVPTRVWAVELGKCLQLRYENTIRYHTNWMI